MSRQEPSREQERFLWVESTRSIPHCTNGETEGTKGSDSHPQGVPGPAVVALVQQCRCWGEHEPLPPRRGQALGSLLSKMGITGTTQAGSSVVAAHTQESSKYLFSPSPSEFPQSGVGKKKP